VTAVPGPGRHAHGKIHTLEGLRGLAILLVVLSHIWVIYPFEAMGDLAPFDGWLKGGSIGVSIFLVLSGFLVTRSMLQAFEGRGAAGPFFPLLRRFIRISAQVYLLLLAILVVAQVDPKDTNSEVATTKSVTASATYTWNWYVREHALEARGDLGHLWYLSAELHVFILLAVAIAFWGRNRKALTIVVVALILAVTWWRWHIYDVEGWYSASPRTSTRADAALYGILAGLLWERAQQWRREAAAVLGAATLVILGVVFSGSQLGIDAYFKGQGIVLAAATAAFVLAAAMDQSHHSPAARLFSALPLRSLGTVSLTLYVWHLPVYWFVSRHTTTWSNLSRTVVTVVALTVLVVVLHRFVDAPLKRWTARIGRTRTPVRSDA
jgi:peptidoglycan/LPS O-acetylase OafA/YrhL